MSTPLLICDDSMMARKQVARSLPSEWDVDITFATNGVEALSAIREGRGEMVFLDLTMPDMDGYEAIEAIRQTEGLKEIPVIAVTAQAMVGDKERCLEAGANDYISKPIDVDRLMQLLEKY